MNDSAQFQLSAPRVDLPQPVPRPHNVPEPQDREYPGILRLYVDASDVQRRIFDARLTVPIQHSGGLTLMYPEWLPAFHSPKAQIELFAGLTLTAAGQKLSWRRDPVDVYAFHVEVPQGVTEVEARYQYLAPTDKSQGRVTVPRDMLDLQWNTVILHPAGYYARNVTVQASATLPARWKHACALKSNAHNNLVEFEPVKIDVLIDSPLYAGRNSSRIALAEDVHLNLFADRPEQLNLTEEQTSACKRLVSEACALFGARHYDHYEFLVALSADVGANGIEHHRCCEIASSPDLFTEWDKNLTARSVLGHEYVHSWNGKYRRGADSWQPCFHKPIRNSLMWVYEGLTQYLGQVLCARAGIWTAKDLIGSLATVAGDQMTRKGRIWRSMSDTTRDPIIAERAELPWPSWQRSEDYYTDGQLMWLEIDMIIRGATEGRKSLDDFAKIFFGMKDRDWVTNTYTFEDVTAALAQTHDYPWAVYLDEKLSGLADEPPLGGFPKGGYQLVFKEEENDFAASQSQLTKTVDLSHSIGIKVTSLGKVTQCVWGSPAFDAGITAGSHLLAVNGFDFSPSVIKEAVDRTSKGRSIELAVKHGLHVFETELAYSGGAKHPHLVPNGPNPLLDSITIPTASGR